MNGKGIALLAIAVVAIGTFALPSTVSLFSGQHTWYDLGAKGNDVPCEKCHADIAAEMEHVGPHTGETGYERLKCEYCHRVFPIEHKNASFDTYTYASGDSAGAEPGKEAHAASTVPCMYCHSGNNSGVVDSDFNHSNWGDKNCFKCHPVNGPNWHDKPEYFCVDDCRKCHVNKATKAVYYIPPAGGFNLTTNATDTGSHAAHMKFVTDAISDKTMEDANEACIACHTGIPVQISWTHAMNLVFNASYCSRNLKETPTHFNTSNYTVNGTVLVISYGNWSGGAKNGSWPEGNIDIWGYNKAS